MPKRVASPDVPTPVRACAIDPSVAIALPGNLLVAPTIFWAGDMDVSELRAARQGRVARVKVNTLSVKEMNAQNI
ncbi:MAG: hypothetical protein AAF231_01965 [Pseudomonadota bacterium]